LLFDDIKIANKNIQLLMACGLMEWLVFGVILQGEKLDDYV
jgi:hypothetical protein